MTSKDGNYPNTASVSGIRIFGENAWVSPSIMATIGHLYSFDVDQNATFPAAITSTKFVKSGGTSAQFLKADGSVDSNTYSKTGHTHTKSQITDFPSSLPASDVKAWAKADTKPTYTGGEVTLTGYSKASSYSAIAASDTINQAIGKLERAISGLENLLASI